MTINRSQQMLINANCLYHTPLFHVCISPRKVDFDKRYIAKYQI